MALRVTLVLGAFCAFEILFVPCLCASYLSFLCLSPSRSQNFDNSRGAPDKLIRHLHYSNGNFGGWTPWSVPCALLGS